MLSNKDKRHGSDFSIAIRTKVNGQVVDAESIEGLVVELRDSSGKKFYPEFGFKDKKILLTYYGIYHMNCGWYRITLYAHHNTFGQAIEDFEKAFNIVPSTALIRKDVPTDDGLEMYPVLDLEADFGMGLRGDSAYQTWLRDGHQGKTEHDFVMWIQQPSVEAAKEARELNKKIEEAEKLRVAAEEKREKAEQARDASYIQSEQARDAFYYVKEKAREESFAEEEQKRKNTFNTSEQARANEFNTNEQKRKEAENIRIANEEKRVSNENTRVNSEKNRVTEENKRIINERERVSEELKRDERFKEIIRDNTNAVNATIGAKNETEQATKDAKDATKKADDAAKGAEDAKTELMAIKPELEEAKDNANESAANADAKAALVDENIALNTQRVGVAVTASNEAKASAENAESVANDAVGVADSAKALAETAKTIAEGANVSISFKDYAEMVSNFNGYQKTKFRVGQNVYVLSVGVPDMWVSAVDDTDETFNYTNDEAIMSALRNDGFIKVGFYRLSELETQHVDLSGYVKNTDFAPNVPYNDTTTRRGVVACAGGSFGISVENGILRIRKASDASVIQKDNDYQPLVTKNIDLAVKTGLVANRLTLTDAEKDAVFRWLFKYPLSESDYEALVDKTGVNFVVPNDI